MRRPVCIDVEIKHLYAVKSLENQHRLTNSDCREYAGIVERKPLLGQRPKPNDVLLEQTISQRSGVGPNELIEGWQSVLDDLLNHLRPYLKPERIVTFRQITPTEKKLFQRIVNQVVVPEKTFGLYLSPSARNQMLYTNSGRKVPEAELQPKDDGVLLFSRPSSHAIIINSLLAHSPYAPAIDVYDQGSLLAGYVFKSIDECLDSISHIIDTYLGGRTTHPPAK